MVKYISQLCSLYGIPYDLQCLLQWLLQRLLTTQNL